MQPTNHKLNKSVEIFSVVTIVCLLDYGVHELF